jgi:hypothetical protein
MEKHIMSDATMTNDTPKAANDVSSWWRKHRVNICKPAGMIAFTAALFYVGSVAPDAIKNYWNTQLQGKITANMLNGQNQIEGTTKYKIKPIEDVDCKRYGAFELRSDYPISDSYTPSSQPTTTVTICTPKDTSRTAQEDPNKLRLQSLLTESAQNGKTEFTDSKTGETYEIGTEAANCNLWEAHRTFSSSRTAFEAPRRYTSTDPAVTVTRCNLEGGPK